MPVSLRLGAFVLILAATGLAACDRKAATQPRSETPVRMLTVKASPYASRLTLTGDVRARTQSDLSFRVSGRIVERLVDVGDHVTRNQLLARLDPAQQQADVVSAEAQLGAAEAQARQAASALQRQRALLEKGFATRSDFDKAQSQAQSSEGAVQSARAAIDIAKSSLGDTELRADSDGIVTARNADVGEVVQAARAIVTIAGDGPRDAVFEADETLALTDIDHRNFELSLVGNPRVKTTGSVREVSPTINATTGTIRVKVGIDDPPPSMTLGALVTISAQLQARPAITLPWTALASADGHPAAWIVDAAGKVALRRIDVLSYETGRIIVSGGLSDGDRVVAEGGKFLTPGQKVVEFEGSGS